MTQDRCPAGKSGRLINLVSQSFDITYLFGNNDDRMALAGILQIAEFFQYCFLIIAGLRCDQ